MHLEWRMRRGEVEWTGSNKGGTCIAPLRLERFIPQKWAHTDYNFKTPSTDLKADVKSVVELARPGNWEIFGWRGDYGDKDSAFTGRLRWVQIDLGADAADADHLITPEERYRVL